LRPGCWPRFRAVDSGEPIYIGADGARVASAALGRPGYHWVGDFGVSALLARCGDQGSVASTPQAEPAPGDPGTCPGDTAHGYSRHAPEDPRAVIARAAMLRAALTPSPRSICEGVMRTTRAPAAHLLAASDRR